MQNKTKEVSLVTRKKNQPAQNDSSVEMAVTLDVPQTAHQCAAVLHRLCPPHVPLHRHHHHHHLHLLFQDQLVLLDPLVCQEARVCQDLEDQMDA